MSEMPNIVLVHGAWADGSSWSAVNESLQADGYTIDGAAVFRRRPRQRRRAPAASSATSDRCGPFLRRPDHDRAGTRFS